MFFRRNSEAVENLYNMQYINIFKCLLHNCINYGRILTLGKTIRQLLIRVYILFCRLGPYPWKVYLNGFFPFAAKAGRPTSQLILRPTKQILKQTFKKRKLGFFVLRRAKFAGSLGRTLPVVVFGSRESRASFPMERFF